ncbi:TetR family transcriptional regulator [Catellatospora sichuanensis]|uniref:acyl-CoA-like ligand-binding transcription factor n=1 Tax=Catellatospora sichuanensis TaxID=1969805 RepID=UPI001181D4BA|nr:TetR family transcriptional regulator [Catellatospora sichuanensis]
MSSSGLRERKKQKTRWLIQEHALRLFTEQGYDATTVEQIAAAAEISPSTFFRYFATKEDVVLDDEYDPMLASAVAAAPVGMGPVDALRHAVRSTLGNLPDADRDKLLLRARLQNSVPAVRARLLDNLLGNIKLISAAVAPRTGRPEDDLEVQIMAGACFGAMLPAIFAWVDSNGTLDLAKIVDDSLTKVGKGFTP